MRSELEIAQAERAVGVTPGSYPDPDVIELADHDARAGEGSEQLTRWCPTCRERAVPMRDGTCGFCQTPLEPRSQEIVIEPGASLEQLAETINREHDALRRSGQEMIEHAIRCGRALLDAQQQVGRGGWLAWFRRNVHADLSNCYRYMRLAEHRDVVLASGADSINAAMRVLADVPRRGHGPRAYTDADKRDWTALADQIGVKPAARVLGISPSTLQRWAAPRSNDRDRDTVKRNLTEERIERLAEWLCERFGGYEYSERVTAQVRADAALALTRVFTEETASS